MTVERNKETAKAQLIELNILILNLRLAQKEINEYELTPELKMLLKKSAYRLKGLMEFSDTFLKNVVMTKQLNPLTSFNND